MRDVSAIRTAGGEAPQLRFCRPERGGIVPGGAQAAPIKGGALGGSVLASPPGPWSRHGHEPRYPRVRRPLRGFPFHPSPRYREIQREDHLRWLFTHHLGKTCFDAVGCRRRLCDAGRSAGPPSGRSSQPRGSPRCAIAVLGGDLRRPGLEGRGRPRRAPALEPAPLRGVGPARRRRPGGGRGRGDAGPFVGLEAGEIAGGGRGGRLR